MVQDKTPIRLRIGTHAGFVIAGVVGRKMPRYHLFGETVTIAEEMEQRGVPGGVCISETTHNACGDAFECVALEPVHIAGHSKSMGRYRVLKRRVCALCCAVLCLFVCSLCCVVLCCVVLCCVVLCCVVLCCVVLCCCAVL